MITSPQNSRIKNVVKLRDRRPRKQQGLFLIDGQRQIDRALQAGMEVTQLYLPEHAEADASDQELRDRAQAAGVEILEVTRSVFPKIAYGQRELDWVAVAQTPSYQLADLQLPSAALVLVVEQIEKPGNLGAMLRTADAAGCDALLVADPVTDITNPNVIRASLGAVFSLPIAQADSPEVCSWLKAAGMEIMAARVDGAVEYTNADFRGSVALVLGSEAHGLSDAWQGDSMKAIRLPMRGIVDSLNVSATAAVLLYEAQRQRSG